jgi:site-specific DNA recombinase
MSKPIVASKPSIQQVSPQPNKQKTAAIYVRVSTEDQGKGYSIPTQIEACQRLAQQEGYHVPDSHLFVDEGISGTTLDRPALRRVRELVISQAIAALIILDPDRLSRKMGKLLVLTDELQAATIPLLCVSHPVEYGPEGTLFFQMRGVIAEYEREKALERMHRGKIGRVKHGYYGGGGIPYGYSYIPEAHKGTIVIDEGEAAIVRRIFAMYGEGIAIHTIAVQLTREGILPKRASAPCKWQGSSIHAILHNATYVTGTMLWNKRRRINNKVVQTRDRTEWLEIPVPSVLSQEVFEAAQQQSRRNARFAQRNRKYEYLFIGGRLRCGRCGASMSGYAPPKRVPRYRCASLLTHHPGEPFCGGGIRVDHIEPLVWREIERALSDPAVIMAELERREHGQGATTNDMTKERQALQKALAALEREAQRWDEAYAQEVIDLTELKAKKLDITERKQRLLAQQETVEAAMHAAQQAQAQARDILLYCQQVQEQLRILDAPHKRQALEALDIRVTWGPGEPIHIEGSIAMDAIASSVSSRTGSSPNTARGICVA